MERGRQEVVEPHTPLQIAVTNLLVAMGMGNPELLLEQVGILVDALTNEGIDVPSKMVEPYPTKPHLELVHDAR